MKARAFARPKKLINALQIYKKKPDFPSLADEIAEPRPDMNIKVAAFTVSEKSSDTTLPCVYFSSTQTPLYWSCLGSAVGG